MANNKPIEISDDSLEKVAGGAIPGVKVCCKGVFETDFTGFLVPCQECEFLRVLCKSNGQWIERCEDMKTIRTASAGRIETIKEQWGID
jgi:hypothetical protein